MKFGKLVDARRAIWQRLLTELAHLEDLGALEDECENEFDMRRMEKAREQIRASLKRRIHNGDIR